VGLEPTIIWSGGCSDDHFSRPPRQLISVTFILFKTLCKKFPLNRVWTDTIVFLMWMWRHWATAPDDLFALKYCLGLSVERLRKIRAKSRVARWYIFKPKIPIWVILPKIPIWVILGRSCNGRCWFTYFMAIFPDNCYILGLLSIQICGHLVHFLPFWYIVPRQIWQPWQKGLALHRSPVCSFNGFESAPMFVLSVRWSKNCSF
jgi:hypothetical protein